MMRISLFVAALALVMAATAPAAPLWAERVDVSNFDEQSQALWSRALESWDILDSTRAVEEIRAVAERHPEDPELWLALASAAEEAASTSDREMALSRLMTAQTALARLSVIGVDGLLEIRANLLNRSVEAQYNALTEQLAELHTNPPALSTLGGGMQVPLEARPTRTERDSTSPGGGRVTRSVRVNAGLSLERPGDSSRLNQRVSLSVN